MNWRIRATKDIMLEVLAVLGYCEDGSRHSTRESGFRRQNFHLIIHERPSTLSLTLHRDAVVPYPPGHKAVFKGVAVKDEFNKILTAYHTRMKCRRLMA